MTETSQEKAGWQEVAKTAQEYRDASIGRVEPAVPDVPQYLPRDVTPIPRELLSKEEVEITQTLTEDLLKSLASGELTSITITKAFLRRAGLAQKLVSPDNRATSVAARLKAGRPIVLRSSYLRELSPELKHSMTTMRSISDL